MANSFTEANIQSVFRKAEIQLTKPEIVISQIYLLCLETPPSTNNYNTIETLYTLKAI